MSKQPHASPATPVVRVLASGLTCLALAWSGWAHAEIYKFVDDNGHVTYTNMPRPGAKKLQLGQPAGKPDTGTPSEKKRSSASNPTPGYFPRVDPGTQRKRDDMRRQLLVEELRSEERNLAASRSELANGSRRPGTDIGKLTESVRMHEKNIEMLNKELSHIR